MHDYHEGLAGYDPAQILHDGCGECEDRSREPSGGLIHLDRGNFARAWARAAEWHTGGLGNLARCELPMLCVMRDVQIKLEQYGVPIGQVPHA
jgi:hypothetical protein